MRKVLIIVLGSIAGLCVLAAALFWVSEPFATKERSVQKAQGQPTLPMTTITIGTTTLQVEVATTEIETQQGLSGRPSLALGSGMLFIFDPPRVPGFWMKDMLFPLDIIFIDQKGRVVTVHKNIAPQTYPTTFRPSVPARYVLEVPAGFADTHRIAEGAKVVVQ